MITTMTRVVYKGINVPRSPHLYQDLLLVFSMIAILTYLKRNLKVGL